MLKFTRCLIRDRACLPAVTATQALFHSNAAEFESRDRSTPLATICDINENMLEVGKERAQSLGYSDGESFIWFLSWFTIVYLVKN